MEADLKNPNLGRPDFEFSYNYPKELDEPFAILEHLPHNRLLKPPKLKRVLHKAHVYSLPGRHFISPHPPRRPLYRRSAAILSLSDPSLPL